MFESARTCMPLALRQDVYFLISILYKFIIERKIVFWSKWLTRCQSCLGLSSLYYSRYRACGWRVSDGLVNTSDLMRFCTDEFSSTLSNKYSSDLVGIGWILKKKKCKKKYFLSKNNVVSLRAPYRRDWTLLSIVLIRSLYLLCRAAKEEKTKRRKKYDKKFRKI